MILTQPVSKYITYVLLCADHGVEQRRVRRRTIEPRQPIQKKNIIQVIRIQVVKLCTSRVRCCRPIHVSEAVMQI